MIAKVYSATVLGIDAFPIEVEVDISIGLSIFNIVGLPDSTIKESRDRVMSAITNSGFSFPIRRVIVNLAPAHLRKIGSGFDLPIALGLLGALGIFPAEQLQKYMVIGELALDGKIRPVRGILPLAIAARNLSKEGLILPRENEAEAAVVEGLTRLPVSSLQDAVTFLMGQQPLPSTAYDTKALFQQQMNYEADFQQVKGQEFIKRALEVAAAGNHNLLMSGPPGSGKTMLARRLPTVLPLPTFEEALEITKIHSIAGLLPENTPLLATRPFRYPHHTISAAGLVGGGSIPGPGEISLSHNGVLFLDELPEFPSNILELLRQPLEDHRVVISRASMSIEFPCDFLLVAAMNPCPCGYFGVRIKSGPAKACVCTPPQIHKYRNKVSGPLMDRIDIQLDVPAVDFEQLTDQRRGESSAQIRDRVALARNRQLERFQTSKTRNNASMNSSELETYTTLSTATKKIMEMAHVKMGLSARAYDRILKVARTIADLADSKNIETPHLTEAINYRSFDRGAGG